MAPVCELATLLLYYLLSFLTRGSGDGRTSSGPAAQMITTERSLRRFQCHIQLHNSCSPFWWVWSGKETYKETEVRLEHQRDLNHQQDVAETPWKLVFTASICIQDVTLPLVDILSHAATDTV